MWCIFVFASDGEKRCPNKFQKRENCFSLDGNLCSEYDRLQVGLTGFKCRCEYVFCGAHRLAEQHDCDFDYKRAGRKHLAESNPLIQASKMDKL